MLVLRAADVQAEIAPDVGGRLASLTVGGRELLLGPAGRDDEPIGWGCFLMAPWPGRLENARFDWRGRTIQLPRTFGRNAIHGLVWNRPWTVDRQAVSRATLSCALPPEWPMGGLVRQVYELTSRSLTFTASVTAGDAMPAALGWHPWFARRDGDVAVRVDARAVLETQRLLPTGALVPATGRLDLRDGPLLGRRRLDHAYPAVTSPASIAWPDLRLALTFEPAPGVVVVHTPPTGVCVEPQTAAPNALALPPASARTAGVRFLAAGETLTASLNIRWE